ncbi:MAG: ribbon-helix-helix domain-containing protein [Proteobacteria bacterium]|nr:ribbon-helix-helix domain-containing protein [Pseudomonadota bacterium]
MSSPMRTVSFKLPEHLDEVLSELARRRGSSRSALVREALEALASGERPGVTAAADALVKPVTGPADLSTKDRHLVGYGR